MNIGHVYLHLLLSEPRPCRISAIYWTDCPIKCLFLLPAKTKKKRDVSSLFCIPKLTRKELHSSGCFYGTTFDLPSCSKCSMGIDNVRDVSFVGVRCNDGRTHYVMEFFLQFHMCMWSSLVLSSSYYYYLWNDVSFFFSFSFSFFEELTLEYVLLWYLLKLFRSQGCLLITLKI